MVGAGRDRPRPNVLDRGKPRPRLATTRPAPERHDPLVVPPRAEDAARRPVSKEKQQAAQRPYRPAVENKESSNRAQIEPRARATTTRPGRPNPPVGPFRTGGDARQPYSRTEGLRTVQPPQGSAGKIGDRPDFLRLIREAAHRACIPDRAPQAVPALLDPVENASTATGARELAKRVQNLLPHYLKKAHAANTKSTYSSGWNSYVKFCKQLGQEPTPVTEEKLLNYVVAAHQSGTLQAASLRNYVNAIVLEHKLQGHMDPRTSALPRPLLNGCKRIDKEAGRIERRADKMTTSELDALFDSLDPLNFREARYGFYLSLTLAGSARAHEVVLARHTGVRLRWENVTVVRKLAGVVRLDISQPLGSKTRQFDSTTVVSMPRTGLKSCVYKWMRAYRTHLPAQHRLGSSPVFVCLDRPGLYTYRHALDDSKHYSARAGLGHLRITTHSGRVSIQNLAVAGGMTLEEQLRISRWTTAQSALRYVRPDRQATSALVATALTGSRIVKPTHL